MHVPFTYHVIVLRVAYLGHDMRMYVCAYVVHLPCI